MFCSSCGAANVDGVQFCSSCGRELARAAPTPYYAPGPPSPAGGDETTAKLIPYRNPYALAAYYTGLFSFICLIGNLLAPAALGLGIAGLRHLKQNPDAHGVVHAWIGIVLGGIFTIVHWGLLIAMVLNAARS